MEKKVLITGGHGLLGSTLKELLVSNAYNVHVLTADVRNRGEVHRELSTLLPHFVVHTAALTNVARCEKEPDNAFAVNAEGTNTIVSAARENNARLIHISTCSVFSGATGNYKEDDVVEPNSVYDRTKIQAEEYVRTYDNALILRLNLIGIHPDGSRGKNFLEWLTDSIRSNVDVRLFTDARVNPLSNWSVATYIQRLLEQERKEPILHLGTRDALSKAEIGRLILEKFPEYTGTVTEISVDELGDGATRPKESWLNTDKAEKIFGRMPSIEEELHLIDLMGGFQKGR